jgi:hypothetical protein
MPRSFRTAFPRAALPVLIAACIGAGCGGGSARYPAREPGCAVKTYPGEPPAPVDDLGVVRVECADASTCERQLRNEVCRRGGDIAWGTGENALNATTLVAHVAHSRRATQGPRERGCAVQVFVDAPAMRTENIGPVTASCAESDSRDVCLRELQDQVCLLGGDVLWQVDGPHTEETQTGVRQRMNGRAAHSKK